MPDLTRRGFLGLLGGAFALGAAGLYLPTERKRVYSFLTNNPLALPSAAAVCIIPPMHRGGSMLVSGRDQWGRAVAEVLKAGDESVHKFTGVVSLLFGEESAPGQLQIGAVEAALVTVHGDVARPFAVVSTESDAPARQWGDYLTNAEWGDGTPLPADPRRHGGAFYKASAVDLADEPLSVAT